MQDMKSDLNKELAELQYHFCRTADHYSLCIDGTRAIHFPHQAGGLIAGGSGNWIANKHAKGAIHEPAMVAALLCLLRRSKDRPLVFFDIGALYGYFSLVVKALLPEASVYAFEMNPHSFDAMDKNFRANQHLGAPLPIGVNVGLSDHTEKQHNSTVSGFILDENVTEGQGVPLDLIRLDDFCRHAGLKPDIIKMDVEGYQAKILPGAMETIAAAKPAILLEFDGPDAMKRFSTTNALVVQPLFALGYRLFWCRFQRGRDAHFTYVAEDEMSNAQERNSLGVFVAP